MFFSQIFHDFSDPISHFQVLSLDKKNKPVAKHLTCLKNDCGQDQRTFSEALFFMCMCSYGEMKIREKD